MKISGYVPSNTKKDESRLIHQYIEGEEMMVLNDELEEIKKLSSAARTMKGQTVAISLELTKWNLKFRKETVKHLGEKFDQLYGTGILYTEFMVRRNGCCLQ